MNSVCLRSALDIAGTPGLALEQVIVTLLLQHRQTHTHTHKYTHPPTHAHTPCLVATSAITLNDVSQINCCSLPVARLRRFHRGKDSARPRESGL